METQAIIFEKKYLQARVPLPSSKSLSNRWLVLAFLYGKKIHLENISDSEDTLLMQDLLEKIEENEGEEKEITLDCRNAGSVMRFLTAQVAFKSGIWILTGNERMQHRPIGSLVEALRGIGIRIDYLGEEACPPMKIFGNEDILKTEISKISVDASLSSQFVSALMLTSPLFPRGLHIEILGEDKVSLPYIQMTAQIMRNGGLEVIFIDGSNIFIDGLLQLPSKIFVEADWTSASYLYTLLALSEGGRIVLP
ncbi:MAG: 3-phosphoshikimate 1-carboxyvinyltransferase, partial [Bacteroidales bacterium]